MHEGVGGRLSLHSVGSATDNLSVETNSGR